MTYAYDTDYVEEIMENMGCMMECAVYTMGYDAGQFLNFWITSGIAREMESLNPKYTVGMSGVELALEVVRKTFGRYLDIEDEYFIDKSPEYWGMWALAYYQIRAKLSYQFLLEAVNFNEILQLYPALHEMDITHFVDAMDIKIEYYRRNKATSLARYRRLRGYSQRLLAEQSGVSLRMIQLYEQKQNDIGKAQAETLLHLAKVLGCSIEQLLE